MRPSRLLRRLVVVGALSSGLLVLVPGTAAAHPLGNFTVNRYSGLVVGVDSVRVDHVLDVAEIPTAQRMPAIDDDNDGVLTRAELATYAESTCADAAGALELTKAGVPVRLSVGSSEARTVAGQAGLPTLRVQCALSAPTASLTGTTTFSLVDTAAEVEIGWREVTAAGDGITLVESDVAVRSESRRLTRYPVDLLSSPLDVRAAKVKAAPGGPAIAEADLEVASTGLPTGRLTSAFENLVTRYDGSPQIVLVGLLAAVALGAAHAVAPGHGKTVMAFYLSGRHQGAVRAAGTVAATVTVTHTAGVLLLGVLVSAGTGFVPARLYPWLTIASGLLVAAVGVTLLRSTRHPHAHPHPHAHGHSHPQPDSDVLGDRARVGLLVGSPAMGPSRSASIAGLPTQEPTRLWQNHRDYSTPEHGDADHAHRDVHDDDGPVSSRSSLIAMGMAGGLVPSPSALIVFLAALAVGHALFGVLLVVAFGLGMAATLAVVGLAVMRLRMKVEGRLEGRTGSRAAHVVRALPVMTACAVLVLGLGISARGAGTLGG